MGKIAATIKKKKRKRDAAGNNIHHSFFVHMVESTMGMCFCSIVGEIKLRFCALCGIVVMILVKVIIHPIICKIYSNGKQCDSTTCTFN